MRNFGQRVCTLSLYNKGIPGWLTLITALALLCLTVPHVRAEESRFLTLPAGTIAPAAADALAAGWGAVMLEGDLSSAYAQFTAARKADDASPIPYFSLAMVQMERARYSDAIDNLLSGLVRGGWTPWHEVALADLGELLDNMNAPDAVKEALLKRLARDDLSCSQRILLRERLCQLFRHVNQVDQAVETLRDEAYVRNWMVLGPFNNRDGGAFEQEHEVEEAPLSLMPDKRYAGRGREIGWIPARGIWNGQLDLGAVLFPGTEMFAYALAFVESDREQDASLVFGAGGASALWVNGEQLARNDKPFAYDCAQRVLPVRLRKGLNQILVKIGGNRSSACVFSLQVLPVPVAEFEVAGSAAKFDANGESIRFLADAETMNAFAANPPAVQENAGSPDLDRAGIAWGALAAFDRMAKADPENALAFLSQAYLMILRGVDNDAWLLTRPPLDKAVKLCPKSTLALELAATVHPDENEARRLLERAAEGKEAYSAREQVLDRLQSGGFLRETETRAKALLTEVDSAYAWRQIGNVHLARGWTAEAVLAYRKAIALSPHWAGPYLNLYDTVTSDTEAMEILEKGLSRAADPMLRFYDAQRLARSHQYEKAETAYRAILQLNRYDTGAWTSLADISRAQGDTETELSILKDALVWLPQSPGLLERIGRRIIESGDREEGLAWLRRALTIRSDNPDLASYIKALEPQRELWFADVDIHYDELKGKDASPEDYPLFNRVGLLDQGYIRVNANGTTRKMIHWVQKVLRPGGVPAVSQEQIPYDPARQKVEIIRARVVQPDGTILENANVSDSGYRGGVGGGVYSQYQTKVVSLPQVREGSIVELQYTIEDTDAKVYADEFEEGFFFGSIFPNIRFEFTADVPEGMEITHNQALTDIRPTVNVADGRRVVQWTAQNLPGVEMEPMMPPQWDFVPSLRVSSFADWNEVGAWYWNLSREQMDLPDDLKAEVAGIVKDCKTRDETIAAVFDWITGNIRYVSISFGLFGCKPHKAERTWRTLYGDCKDTAVLFCAMLREAGIDAKVALVRTYDRGREPTGVPGARLFNHAIAYVPPEGEGGQHYWLDGTTDYFRFGEVPMMDRGGMALITGPEGGRLVTIDKATADMNRSIQESVIKVGAGGAGTIRRTETVTGELAPPLRSAAETPERIRTAISMLAASRFAGATLADFSIHPDDDEGGTGGITLEMTFDAPRLARKTAEGYRIQTVLLPGMLSRRFATQRERQHDMMLGMPLSRSTRAQVILPEGATLLNQPKPLDIKHDFAYFTRTVTPADAGVVIETTLCLTVRRLSAEDYPAFRRFCNQVDSAQEEWLTYAVDEAAAETEPVDEKTPSSIPFVEDTGEEEVAD